VFKSDSQVVVHSNHVGVYEFRNLIFNIVYSLALYVTFKVKYTMRQVNMVCSHP